MFAEGVDLKSDRATIGTLDGLGLQIDTERCVGAALRIVHQGVQLIG